MTSLEHESNDTSVSASDYGNDNWDNENWGDMDVRIIASNGVGNVSYFEKDKSTNSVSDMFMNACIDCECGSFKVTYTFRLASINPPPGQLK